MKLQAYYLFALVIAMVFLRPIAGQSQSRPKQDIRRVIVTSEYTVRDGKRLPQNFAVKQELKDSLGRIHTIIFRDKATREIVSYVWITYNGMQKVKEEEFRDGKMYRFRTYSYTSDTLIDKERVFMVEPGDTALYVTLNYRYDSHGNPVEIKAFNGRGRRVYRAKSVFDANGLELSRKVKVRHHFTPVDSVISFVCKPQYDSLGRVITKEVAKTFANGKRVRFSVRYSYNPKNGLLIGEERFDTDGKLLYRKKFDYNAKGILKFISVFNDQGELVRYFAKRYELYRNSNRRQRIVEY